MSNINAQNFCLLNTVCSCGSFAFNPVPNSLKLDEAVTRQQGSLKSWNGLCERNEQWDWGPSAWERDSRKVVIKAMKSCGMERVGRVWYLQFRTRPGGHEIRLRVSVAVCVTCSSPSQFLVWPMLEAAQWAVWPCSLLCVLLCLARGNLGKHCCNRCSQQNWPPIRISIHPL